MKEPVVICLGAGKAQVPLIQTAKNLGYAVVGIDRNSEVPGFHFVDKKLIVSTYDTQSVISELVLLQKVHNKPVFSLHRILYIVV